MLSRPEPCRGPLPTRRANVVALLVLTFLKILKYIGCPVVGSPLLWNRVEAYTTAQ